MSIGFDALLPGTPIGPHAVSVSAAANERYWRAAGLDHPALAGGALYPPIAANLTILAFLETCPEPMIQTRQRLACHRAADAGVTLVTAGRVADRYEKRGRTYVDVEATVRVDGDDAPLWTSVVTFTPAATLSRPGRDGDA